MSLRVFVVTPDGVCTPPPATLDQRVEALEQGLYALAEMVTDLELRVQALELPPPASVGPDPFAGLALETRLVGMGVAL